MWARFRTSTAEHEQKYPVLHKSFNVNEEYVHATRSQSYVDFFAKAQLLFTEPSSPSNSCRYTMDQVLLEPDQCLVPAALESLLFEKPLSDLLLSFFDASAEASRICSSLLRSVNETHANYRFVQRALDRFSHYSPEQYDSAIVELDSFTRLSNPFDSPRPERFGRIRDRYTAILRGLNSRRRKVRRRARLRKFAKRASGVGLTVTCGVLALVGVGIALHSFSGVLLGPALLLLFRPVQARRKLANVVGYFKGGRDGPKRLGERLDVAAKGTYILNRDLDTTSRLVVRLRDEVEHMKETISYCLERREDRFPLQEVVKDLRKRGRGFKQQVDELEEHVCLCLVTINRARVLVMKEIDSLNSKP